MEIEQILSVAKKYDNALLNMGVSEIIRENENTESLSHIRWMLNEIPNQLKENKIEKANRWLGFIQGVLWVRKISTIHELKDDNR